jgi:hypothetical protein
MLCSSPRAFRSKSWTRLSFHMWSNYDIPSSLSHLTSPLQVSSSPPPITTTQTFYKYIYTCTSSRTIWRSAPLQPSPPCATPRRTMLWRDEVLVCGPEVNCAIGRIPTFRPISIFICNFHAFSVRWNFHGVKPIVNYTLCNNDVFLSIGKWNEWYVSFVFGIVHSVILQDEPERFLQC